MNSVFPVRIRSTFPIAALFAMVFAFPCFAQLRVGAALEENRYLQFEKVVLHIAIENNSGNDLEFDYQKSKEAHLSVFVKRDGEDGFLEKRAINASVLGTFRLGAGQLRHLQAVLNSPDMFTLQKEGEYEVWVQAGHPRLANDFRSPTMRLEIREGTKLWSSQVGIPAGLREGPDSLIRSRQVSLLSFSGAEADHYALRIEDDKQVYSVQRLGDRTSGEKPTCEVDALANTHVLIRVSSKVYAYKVFNYRGKQLQTKLLAVDDNEGPPRLVRDRETGVVRHMGGRAARQGEDYEIYSGGKVGDMR